MKAVNHVRATTALGPVARRRKLCKHRRQQRALAFSRGKPVQIKHLEFPLHPAKGTVENYWRAHAIDFEWRPDGTLRTWQLRSAVAPHPVSGRRCWFNQIAFLNEWTLDPELREYLVDVYGEAGLPFTTRFGNGDLISAEVIKTINETYETNAGREPWQAGDLLLREAFQRFREVVVAMADAVRIRSAT